MAQNLVYLDDENFEKTISKGVTLVDFYADWCGPCRMMTPIIATLATKLAGSAQVVKVNTENAPQTTLSFGIPSIPTCIVFKDGREVSRKVGVCDEKTLNDMVNAA